MIKAIALLIILAVQANSAEFLIRAKGSWNDGISTAGMDAKQLRSYNARSRKGDIVAVRPDGFVWGKCECLPDFILVKVPAVTYEQAKQYMQALYDTTSGTPKMLKRRRYRIPSNYVDNAVAAGGVVTFTSKQITSRIEDKLGL